MALFQPFKKDPARPEPPPAPGEKSPIADAAAPAARRTGEEVRAITDRLDGLANLFGEANQQLIKSNEHLLTYLANREAAAAAATVAPPATGGSVSPALEEKLIVVKDKVESVRERLDSLIQKFEQAVAQSGSGGESSDPAAAPAVSDEAIKSLSGLMQQKLDGLEQRSTETGQNLARVHQAIDARLREVDARFQQALTHHFQELQQAINPPPPPEPEAPADWPQVSGSVLDWQQVFWGSDLIHNSALDFQRMQLCSQVQHGDAAACGLAGTLLVFQSASTERMPQVLKELGEAFYRWQPKTHGGATPLELAMVRWLQSRLDAAGAPNTIELVNPGERFDAARHHAATRGVEVTEVWGWVVLRDNGKVYTKASVCVR